MRRERGGAIVGFLAAIGVLVVVMAVFFASCFSSASGQTRSLGPAVEHHHRDGGGDRYGDGGGSRGGDNGDGNDQRRCHRSSGDCRSSFSPGPFKDSPVVICMPNSCNGQDQPGRSGQQPQESPECLLGVPYHCDRPRAA